MKKILLIIIVCILFIIILATGMLYYIVFMPNSNETEEVTIRIPQGTAFDTIVNQLKSQKLIRNKNYFLVTARLFRETKKLKAGQYILSRNLSNYKILKILSKGKTFARLVTIPEGLGARKIATILQQQVDIDSARFMSLVHDPDFINRLKLTQNLRLTLNSLEGLLYPDTYRLDWGMSEEQIIRVLTSRFEELFVDSLQRRAEEIGFSTSQVVTLASVIEGEAVIDSERAIIAALYHNRLQRGQPLEADPTIQFIITDGPRRLLKRDLKIDSPYNTYLYPGIPPGPINNPGIKSIYAALYPVDAGYLYMVAKGDGSHIFSYTYHQHLQAKQAFDQIRREVARKNKMKRAQENGEK